MTWPRQKTYWLLVLAFLAVELLSWLAFQGAPLERFVTGLLIIGALALAWKRPAWLAAMVVGELVVGSLGHLFFFSIGPVIISIRMILFGALLLRAAIDLTRRVDVHWSGFRPRVLAWLFAWVLVMVGWGLVRGQGISTVYTDANAFLYLLLIIPWWLYLRSRPQWTGTVLAILLAGATVVALKSWLMVWLFGQNVSFVGELYRWIRQTGVGEITLINANVYRVFFQSQVYTLLVFCLTFSAWVSGQVPRWWWWPITFSALGVYISLSKSFWLGLAVGLVVLLAWSVKRFGPRVLSRWLFLVPLGLIVWLALNWALYFPGLWPTGVARGNILLERLNGIGASQANTARVNEIKPLLTAISHHPVIGSGFGATVTYYSTDPRVHGDRTTTAFELGYLDLWLKIGLVGLVLYGWWIWQLGRAVARRPGGMMFITGLVALLVTNSTSPYLNHPLGLGFLLLMMLYADQS